MNSIAEQFMSRTLFIYIFRDLLRIFLLALGTLAVIMSFGGLMRPLTRQGLEPTQIGQALAYLLPAMMTYALPIAALFATTFVYGRLSADNEITACRAGGISYWSMVTPAFLLGLMVSIISLLMLCFIVPGLTLRVEQLATSNLARWIAFEIERDHQVKRPDWPYTIFAQSAYLPDDQTDTRQVVVLKGPMIATYERQNAQVKTATQVHIPKNFWMAQEATVYITKLPNDHVQISGRSKNGTMFDRIMHGDRGGTAEAAFGPMDIPMTVREHPKFMDIRQLKNLLVDRSQSTRLQDSFASLIRHDQEQNFLEEMLLTLKNTNSYTFDTGHGETYTLTKPAGDTPSTPDGVRAVTIQSPGSTGREIGFVEQTGGQTLTAKAKEAQMRLDVDPPDQFMVIELRLIDVDLNDGGELDRRIYVPMSPAIVAIANQTLQKYLNGPDVPMNAPVILRHDIVQLTNYIYSEMHGRVSFSISCLILVAAGAALGLMFRSGNFLSAFAVSVIPALLAIALVATGQHVVEGVPLNVTPHNDPVRLGIAIIWSGNLAALIVAGVLLGRLQRQ